MKSNYAFLAFVLVLGSAIPAQTIHSHTLPYGYDSVDGNYNVAPSGGGPFNVVTGNCRWQWTYGWNQFFHQCPVLITQLSFRRSSDASLVGTVYPTVNITMASLASNFASHTAMSATFANNLGPDQTIVYSGPGTIPAYTATASVPAPWLVVFPLSTPFIYDPTKTRDLVIDLQVAGAASVAGTFIIDGVYPSAGVSQNGHTTIGTSATTNWFNADAGPVVLVDYLLGNPVHMDLIANTTTGTGDLFYQILNMPANATHGYTLISTIPSSTFSIPFGRGPAFGIYPDPLTFQIILSPPFPGSPFHWVTPAGGLFPDVALTAPPGSLLGFVGQTWEAVAVALDASGLIAGISPPRQIPW